MTTKFVFVTGGVVSSLGKGIASASLAAIFESRGLSVTLIEAHDLAFGTSRWSSKLVHGGLRYLATGDIATARESAPGRESGSGKLPSGYCLQL